MEPSPTNPPTDFYRLQHRPTTREGNLRSADMRILLSFSGNPPRIVCELAHTRTIACADLSHDTLTARTAVLAGRPDREGRTFDCGSPRAMRPLRNASRTVS